MLLEHSGPTFRRSDTFISAIRQYLCLSLLKNSGSSVPAATQLSCSIFLSLMSKFRSHLKAEVGVFYPMILLKPFELLGPNGAPMALGPGGGAAAAPPGGAAAAAGALAAGNAAAALAPPGPAPTLAALQHKAAVLRVLGEVRRRPVAAGPGFAALRSLSPRVLVRRDHDASTAFPQTGA